MATQEFKDNNYFYKWIEPQFAIGVIHPSIELMRESLIQNIQTVFRKVVYKYIDKKLIAGKHPADRVLDTMLARFIFTQHTEDQTDPVIPSKIIELEGLREDLYNKVKYIDESGEIESKILEELKIEKQFADAFKKLEKWYKSADLSEPTIVKEEKGDQYILKYVESDTEHKVFIKKKAYERIEGRLLEGELDLLLWCLIKRFMMLKSYNNQLAVHPRTFDALHKCYNIGFEMFGSVLNTYHTKYCSLFYDIEKHFGSCGSFFNFTPIQGFYSMNPPFDEIIIKKAVEKLLKNLEDSPELISVIIWIPVWDKAGLKYVQQYCEGQKDGKYYGEFVGMQLLESSKFYKFKKIECINSMSYFDYNLMKEKKASNTNIVVIQNHGEFNEKCLETTKYDVGTSP